jgi:hypothetical protein
VSARLAIVTPPPTKPSEPGLSGAAAAARLRDLGLDTRWFDASTGWFQHTVQPGRLAACLEHSRARPDAPTAAFADALRVARGPRPPLRLAATYVDRRRYSSAVNVLVNTLRLASEPWPGVRLSPTEHEFEGMHPARSRDLARFARAPGPYDAYLEGELLPALERWGPSCVGLSLTFYQQGFAAFRLAALLAERLPGVERILAGPLVDCWAAAGNALDSAPFQLFHRVLPLPGHGDLAGFARGLGAAAPAVSAPLAADLGEAPWEAYLAPQPVVPAAIGRGCYWRRCTFCPDHLHPSYRPCSEDGLEAWLHDVAARFPRGAMLHLTDSALSPRHLLHLARVVERDGLPLRWHGFVRMERGFAEPDIARQLAAGGAALLQWGMESASPTLLERMDKGVGPAQARAVLRACSAAGIKNHVYLLFGQPGETDLEREETLAFVASEGEHIHDLNNALLNLPRGSVMQQQPERFGITGIEPFADDTDLSLYDDFHCGDSHPRLEARRWLGRRFFKSAAVRAIQGGLKGPFGANHSCFLP